MPGPPGASVSAHPPGYSSGPPLTRSSASSWNLMMPHFWKVISASVTHSASDIAAASSRRRLLVTREVVIVSA